MDIIFPAFGICHTPRLTVCNQTVLFMTSCLKGMNVHFYCCKCRAGEDGIRTRKSYQISPGSAHALLFSQSPGRFVGEGDACCVSVFTLFRKLPSMGSTCCVAFAGKLRVKASFQQSEKQQGLWCILSWLFLLNNGKAYIFAPRVSRVWVCECDEDGSVCSAESG